jgi:hypothetical protein
MEWVQSQRTGSFWRGALEAVWVPLLFMLGGLGWLTAERAALAPAGSSAAVYLRRVAPPSDTWLVDGFNVVQVALLGGRDRSTWWSAAQRAELIARAEEFEEAEAPVFVVFDGAQSLGEDPAPGRVRRVFAPSADDWLVDRVRRDAAPERLVVVTADRRLAGRVRHHGARVVSPGEFLGRCRTSAMRGVIPSD